MSIYCSPKIEEEDVAQCWREPTEGEEGDRDGCDDRVKREKAELGNKLMFKLEKHTSAM